MQAEGPAGMLRSMVQRRGLGTLSRVTELSRCLAAGVLDTGCKVLVCRRLKGRDFVLLHDLSLLPVKQRQKLANAGFTSSHIPPAPVTRPVA